MNKPAVVGLVSGLAFVVLTLIAVGVINMPVAKGEASETVRGLVPCPRSQMPLDQGYGWTRKSAAPTCSSGN